MKKYKWLIGVISIVVGFLFLHTSEYMKEKSYATTYIGYVQQTGKSGGIVGAFELKTGEIVDRYVTTGFVLTTKVGDYHVLHMREMDFRQTPMKNALYFFLPCILISFGCVYLLTYRLLD